MNVFRFWWQILVNSEFTNPVNKIDSLRLTVQVLLLGYLTKEGQSVESNRQIRSSHFPFTADKVLAGLQEQVWINSGSLKVGFVKQTRFFVGGIIVD
jgi:hypothetical protein